MRSTIKLAPGETERNPITTKPAILWQGKLGRQEILSFLTSKWDQTSEIKYFFFCVYYKIPT